MLRQQGLGQWGQLVALLYAQSERYCLVVVLSDWSIRALRQPPGGPSHISCLFQLPKPAPQPLTEVTWGR